MYRRAFVSAAVGSTFSGTHLARAQRATKRTIGFIVSGSADVPAPLLAAFSDGLKQSGHDLNQTVTLITRGAQGNFDRLPALVSEVVDLKVSILVTTGAPASLAAKQSVSAVPIVFLAPDPVELGLVASFSRPGGNATGVNVSTPEMTPKRLELLRDLLPTAERIAFLVRPSSPTAQSQLAGVRQATRALGLDLELYEASNPIEIDLVFEQLGRRRPPALLVPADSLFTTRREQIVSLAAQNRIPAIYDLREYALIGGLISYGPSLTEIYRTLGLYAGRILNGTRPADLPVQQPSRFELVLNLRAARALGLAVPITLQERSDEIIE